MSVQVIHDYIDVLRFRIEPIHQVAHHPGKVDFGSSRGDQHLPKSGLRERFKVVE